MECLLRRLGFEQPALRGTKEQPIHILHFHLIVVDEDKLPNSTASEHFRSHTTNASDSHNEHGFLANLLIILLIT